MRVTIRTRPAVSNEDVNIFTFQVERRPSVEQTDFGYPSHLVLRIVNGKTVNVPMTSIEQWTVEA